MRRDDKFWLNLGKLVDMIRKLREDVDDTPLEGAISAVMDAYWVNWYAERERDRRSPTIQVARKHLLRADNYLKELGEAWAAAPLWLPPNKWGSATAPPSSSASSLNITYRHPFARSS